MVRVYVFYSLTHNKFVIKYSTGVNTLQVGDVNQYMQVLLQIIDIDSKYRKKSLKYTINKIKYILRIKRLYRKELKKIKLERRARVKCFHKSL